MIHAIALDDELPALEIIDAFCSQIDFIDLRQTFSRTDQARAYLEKYPVDLLFLDINMPATSGIDFYRKSVRSSAEQNPLVIFTTAYSEFAVESYELQAIDYLLKPFTFERFLQAVRKAADYHQLTHQSGEAPDPYLVFRVDYGLVKVAFTDILFIEGLDNYLKIHRHQQKPLVVRITLKAMLEKLPPKAFVRVHRSYIVAIQKIEAVRNRMISIGGEDIPLSSSYEDGFYAEFRI